MRFQNLSIKYKLIAISMLTSAVALLFALAIYVSGAFFATRNGTMERISSLARVVGTNCVAALTFDDAEAARETLKALSAEPQIVFARIYDDKGAPFAEYRRGDRVANSGSDALSAAAILPVLQSAEPVYNLSYHYRDGQLQVIAPILLDRRPIGAVEVTSDLSDLVRNMKRVAALSLIVLFISFGVAYAVSTLTQRTISGPIINLTGVMNKVSQDKDYSVRVTSDSRDELGTLFRGFNQMLSEIQARDAKLYFTQFSVDHMGDAALWMDASGHIVNVNHAAGEALGVSPEILLAMTIEDIDPSLNPERWATLWAKVQQRTAFTFESAHLRKDGKFFPVEVFANFLSFQGQEFMCVFARNISERKTLQLQLEQAQKMEAIGTLAGGVAHDLNNILGGLVGYPDVLLMGLPPDSTLRKPLLAVKASGEKAAAIVQDMLTLARRGVDLRTAVNLNEIVDEYVKSAEHARIQQFHSSVRFEIRLDPELPNILGSEIHLSKTLMNLVSNAAEAIGYKGQVTISTFRRLLDAPLVGFQTIAEGEYAVLRVEDDGSGMCVEDMTKIFEPFYTKKKMGRSGTGLGMSVVSGTVKDHKGFIDLRSVEDNGTRFDLYFPITRTAVQEKSNNFVIEKHMGTEKILVVDDVREQREIATVLLSKLGYRVEAVNSGEAAILYMRDNAADLIVLDMIMDPGLDGLDTYRQIVQQHPKQKAVVASGFSETSRVRQILALGAGAYVRKPYSLERLGVAVRKVLDGKA
ncbi:MAG: response regulator [Desulfobacterales bacterium]|nr:response regulator [Desulfobacterales bacterium]